MVALGLLWGEHAYLQSSWNVLDGLLVLVSLVDIIVAVASAGGAKILGVLRVLRLLRTLRPLRWGVGGRGHSYIHLGRTQKPTPTSAQPYGSLATRSRHLGALHVPLLLLPGCPLRRPLPGCRVISRAPGLKLVVETLISSLRPIGNIVLICCAFFIIFGILGVQVCGFGSSRVYPTMSL